MVRSLLSAADLSSDELEEVLAAAARAKDDPGEFASVLAGRTVALLFDKPSTRTRVSLEVAVTAMGGHAVVLRSDELQMGRGEPIEDTGRVLSRYVDAIAWRTFAHDGLERLARAASIPVVNALSDLEHPCQAVADLQTIRARHDTLDGVVLAYVGDGNNVANSLLLAGAAAGMEVRVACPSGYEPDAAIAHRAAVIAAERGRRIVVTDVVAEAASGADVLYTDVWASMGRESEADERRRAFEGYRIDAGVVALAHADCIVMHCLPAHRGEEIAADVIDGPRSVVWDQAENRVHANKAVLALLVG